MAEQKRKSQAEKAVTAAKSKKVKTVQSAQKKNNDEQSQNVQIPSRLISSVAFLGLFILFLVIFFGPQGAIVNLLKSIIYGILGDAGFIVSIPALLYLFLIHAFSGKRPVLMRSVCLGLFVVACGCMYHLSCNPKLPGGLELLVSLYTCGSGVLCGLLAMLLNWL